MTHGWKAKQKEGFLEKLTSYEKTKTTQQQTPQHDTHLSPVSWPCRRFLLSAVFPSLRPLPRAKTRISNNIQVAIQLQNALNYPRFHPGCLLTALDQLCFTLSCRRSVVSFRCEEAAPPTSPPPPRSSTPLPSIVVLISCSRAKDNVTTRKTPCCLHV